MNQVHLAGTDLTVSALCLGAGAFMPVLPPERTDRLYEAFRGAGGDFFDSAHCYAFWVAGGLGVPERRLGECIRRHGDEGRVFVATKGGHPNAGAAYRRPDRYLAPEVIAADIRQSLDRLGLPRIDLYLLHRDDTRVPVGEILDALDAEASAGRLRHLGASNWSVARIAEANEYAARAGRRPLIASQVQWSLAESNAGPPKSDLDMRRLALADAAWHARTGLAVMAYSPTAGGYFASGGATVLAQSSSAARKTYDNPVSRARLARAEKLARDLGRSANQVALAWLMAQSFPTIPILGTKDPAHLADALAAADLHLRAEEVRWLSEG